MPWTFLRAGGFAANTLIWAPQIHAGDAVRWPYAQAGRSLIHERDIAAVAVRALTRDGHAGAIHVLTGPEALTQEQQVLAIGQALGRPLRYEEIPAQAALEQMVSDGWPRAFAEHALGYWATLVTRPEPVSPGRPRDHQVTGPHVRGVGQGPRGRLPLTEAFVGWTQSSRASMNILDPGGAISW